MDPHNEIRCYSHYVTINLNMQNLIYVQKTRESQSYNKENRWPFGINWISNENKNALLGLRTNVNE